MKVKALIAIVALFTIITAQAETVSVKALHGIESRIELQKLMLEDKLKSFETNDLTEGKIVAALINMIEIKLAEASYALAAIESDDQINDENIAHINALLDSAESLIEEI